VGEVGVEAVEQAPVAGGFFAPAADLGIGGEDLHVGVLGGQYGAKRGVGTEVRAVFADVGVGAGALRGGA
jgi:hypothetical protein